LAALCSPPGQARRLTTLRNSSFSVKSRLFTGETGFQGVSSGCRIKFQMQSAQSESHAKHQGTHQYPG